MTAQQEAAADPAASVWVSASAGTGKTHVLTNRVLRLLLDGAAPERILCLTYTKAAAAEMANRLQNELAAWAVEPTARLAATLARLTGEPAEVETITRARRLFALVLDAPGGLRIQTLHAFCQSLLGRFPVEVGLPPGFTALDDEAAAALLAEATAEVLASPDAAVQAAVGRLSALASDVHFDGLVQSFVGGRMRLPEDLASATLERYLADLARLLGRRPDAAGGRPEAVAAFVAARTADMAPVRAAMAVLQGGTKTDVKMADRLAACCRAFDYDTYASVFLTGDGVPRVDPITKKLGATRPDIQDWMRGEAVELVAVEEAAMRAEVHQASSALMIVGTAIIDRYHRAKALRRAIDYDDMVIKARDLLTRGAAAAWVLYKLDGGIDHLLIDEAQDTSPAQWQLIRALTGEFFAGTDDGRHRTLFAVGDVKQSIYSFQGAAPEVFGQERRRVDAAARAAEKPFRSVPLDRSFRSAPLVLALVDAVYARDAAKPGVVEGEVLEHKAHREHAGGDIELWPIEAGEVVDEPDGWTPVAEAKRGRSGQIALAERIAARIAGWLHGGEMLPARGRAMRPGDIMILVRRRTPFVDALTRACKARGVPVAGSDRMRLAGQLGVRDLIAMGRFALLPEDDLTLATVLKGPFVGLDEEALFDLAHHRPPGGRLWRSLSERAAERPDFAAAHAALAAVLARADYVTPFTFFTRLLDEDGGRRRLIGRLGREAVEPVEEFLAHALRHEADEAPSLEAFLHAVESGETELKRDLDRGRDEVRILTVHASKGLEAPVVILPDTTALPKQPDGLLWSEGGLPVWALKGAMAVPEVARVRDAMRDADLREYRRLLYVALTRAEDRLVVCGWAGRGDGGHAPDSWYDLIAAAFPADAADEEILPGFTARRLVRAPGETAAERRHLAAAAPPARPLPDWALRPAPVERRPSDPLSPSRAADADLGVASPLVLAGAERFLRGRLVHRMLELLPDLDPARRGAAAARFLETRAPDLDAGQREALRGEILAVLDHPGFAPVFGPGSRPEVPVAAVIGAETVVGQIDRLVVLPDRVLIVDFKTDRPSPADWRAVAPGYVRQLALYRAVVARLYPRLPVEAALLWTETPRLMPVPGEGLDASLAGLTGATATVDAAEGSS
ncbi:double-strand break repair helicase AddA [Zavarzinia compransoris]|uniref:double-strand break repair helicase AddA n=1 Tax=Zavarzinia marina TaxID=2911065 RepID=UPI001F38CCB2|nr:double-strand break repair helicase AddA [Zavarzinia marina]MCF4167648.1 double-strand break repair helicase AddA [Zavarzinia marina]